MIPDFKTYIGESVWSDIHKRSIGSSVRKEDEINDSWDLNEMYGYMIDHYKCKYTTDGFMKSTWSLTAAPFTFKNGSVFLSLKPYETFKLITCSYSVNKIPSFFKELSEKYTVKKVFGKGNDAWYEIYPKGSNHLHITNTFFVEVFDYFLNFDGEEIDGFEKLIEKK